MSWNIRRDPFTGKQSRHDGIDLPFGMNESMGAFQDGTVSRIENDPNGYGWYIDVKHDDGTTGRYAHAGIINKAVGHRVKRGEELGLAGSTGRSTGPHVHFEHHDRSGTAVDPRPFLTATGGRPQTQFAAGPQTAPTQNQGGPNMATALPMATGLPPAGLEEYVRQAQALIPQAKPSPELQAMMQQNMQRRANNLPLAMGAMLSGDKGMQGLGGLMYRDANDAMNPQALGEEGFFDPRSGQFISNPIGEMKRKEKMLEIATKLSQSAQDNYTRQQQTAQSQAFMQYIQGQGLLNQWEKMSFEQQQAHVNNWLKSRGLEIQQAQENRAAGNQVNNQVQWADQPPAAAPAGGPPMPPMPPVRPVPQFNPPVPGQAPPPITQAAPPVTQAAPPVTQAAPPVTQAAPPVVQPPVAEAAPAGFQPRVARQIPSYEVAGHANEDGADILRITAPGPENGKLFVQRPDGFHLYDPSKGMIDSATFKKDTAAAKDVIASATKLEGLTEQVRANPKAFNLVNSAANTVLPQALANRVTSAVNGPESMQLRAKLLKDAAEEMNRLFGAAQSVGEASRASEFLIQTGDNAETILNKLKGARDYAETLKSKFGPAFTRAANLQLTGGSSATNTSALPNATGASRSPFKDPNNPTDAELEADMKRRLGK